MHCLHLFVFFYLITIFLITFDLFFFQDHQFLVSRPPLSKGGPIQDVPVSAASEAPEDLGLDKKRKRVEELASLSASAHKNVAREASALEDEEVLFDALDS
jgi:hypothetical protein